MSTVLQISEIHAKLDPLRTKLLEHPLYQRIDAISALRTFLEHHVFAVWDFMSLLKALQRRICCVDVPWTPPVDAASCRLINEIVLGEESDEDGAGGYASHFDLYHVAMMRAGANTRPIDTLIAAIRRGDSVTSALESPDVPSAVKPFVAHTFDVIARGDIVEIASAFTFGREDLLPDVFQRIVDELNVECAGGLDDFRYYLARHIEVDGGEHGPMAERLMESLCGTDSTKWRAAQRAAVQALDARLALWDGICAWISA